MTEYEKAVEHLRSVLDVPPHVRGIAYSSVLKAACKAVIWHATPRDPQETLEEKVDKILFLLQQHCRICGGRGKRERYDTLYQVPRMEKCECQLKESSS